MTAPAFVRHRSPHAGRLERFLGPEAEALSASMRGWYGPPIRVAGVPGGLVVGGDGDFRGAPRVGFFTSLLDRLDAYLRRAVAHNAGMLGAGFSSVDGLIAAATNPATRRDFAFVKTGTTGVANVTSSLWRCAGQPSAAAASSAAPGGRVPTDATPGAFPFVNPTGGQTQHILNAFPFANAINTLLLYDRIYDVAKTMNSIAAEAVSGVPTRYQSAVASAADYAGGNFMFVEVGTVLPATAHNWTTINYVNQAGNAAVLPSLAGVSGAIVNRLDHAGWFAPLAAGDTGIKALTQIQASALVASGAVDFAIGHPLAWFPLGIAALVVPFDGVNTLINLARVFDDAAMAFLEVSKPATTAATYSGFFTTVSA